MAKAADVGKLSVDDLLSLRAQIERALADRRRDLEKQIALLADGREVERRRRPPSSGSGRVSAMRGKSVPPKYRGPGGETWTGRGVMPRWLAALVKQGRAKEQFLIGAGRKRRTAASAKKKEMKKKALRPTRKPRRRKASEAKSGAITA